MASHHRQRAAGDETEFVAPGISIEDQLTKVDAVDRQTLAGSHPQKLDRWPRTERRQARIASVLSRRQPDLTVVLENIHDPHNVSAILRSCDAVGVLRVHTVYSVEEPPPGAFARQTSASAAKWVEVMRHRSLAQCFDYLRAENFRILVTSVGSGARQLFDWEFLDPVALVFGNEMRGASVDARTGADGAIEIPMAGMVESLNVSVACAVCLFEVYRQRRAAGAYDAPKLDRTARRALEDDWLRR